VKPFSESGRQEFLAATHVAVLSVAADGRPPATVPIWYDYVVGGDIRFTTGASSRKAKLIERAGVVSLAVQREEPPYQYVVVEGTVVNSEPTPRDFQEAMAVKYLGEEAGRQFVRNFDEMASTLFTIRPDRWITADFSGLL
jgi:PPOX class probable F420-dependent enzyme